MKIAIVGSRKFQPLQLVTDYVIKLNQTRNQTDGSTGGTTLEIVSGGAIGVDETAVEAAKTLGIPYKEFLPDYITYHLAAPIMRNDKIVEYCDELVAFWDGTSKGTRYTINRAKWQGKKVTIIRMPVSSGMESPLQGDEGGSTPPAGTIYNSAFDKHYHEPDCPAPRTAKREAHESCTCKGPYGNTT